MITTDWTRAPTAGEATFRTALVDALRRVADRRGVSNAEIARRVGVSRNTIRLMWRHERQTDIDTLAGVARVLGVELGWRDA